MSNYVSNYRERYWEWWDAWRGIDDILRRVMSPADHAALMDRVWTSDPLPPPGGMVLDALPRRRDDMLWDEAALLRRKGLLSRADIDRISALLREITDGCGGTDILAPEAFFFATSARARTVIINYINEMPDDALVTQDLIWRAVCDEVHIGRDAMIPIIRDVTNGHLKQRHAITFGELRRRGVKNLKT